MTTLSEIGRLLRAARKGKGLFKTRLADLSGLHRNTIADLEAGRGNVEMNTLLAVCDQLDLDLSFTVRKPNAPPQPLVTPLDVKE